MPDGDLIAWFKALPPWTQIFFGLFAVFMALPIATLTILQLIESLRYLLGSPRTPPGDDDGT